jgi:hypothetical protein
MQKPAAGEAGGGGGACMMVLPTGHAQAHQAALWASQAALLHQLYFA